jgi:hypothetical protein
MRSGRPPASTCRDPGSRQRSAADRLLAVSAEAPPARREPPNEVRDPHAARTAPQGHPATRGTSPAPSRRRDPAPSRRHSTGRQQSRSAHAVSAPSHGPGTHTRPRRPHPAPAPTQHGTTAASERTHGSGANTQSRHHHTAPTPTRGPDADTPPRRPHSTGQQQPRSAHTAPARTRSLGTITRPRRRHAVSTLTRRLDADTARSRRDNTFMPTQHGTTAASERRCSTSRSREGSPPRALASRGETTASRLARSSLDDRRRNAPWAHAAGSLGRFPERKPCPDAHDRRGHGSRRPDQAAAREPSRSRRVDPSQEVR